MNQKLSEDQKQKIRPILMVSGAMFILGSLFALASPDTINGFTGMDSGTIRIFGAALFVVGLADIVLANTIFAKNIKIEP